MCLADARLKRASNRLIAFGECGIDVDVEYDETKKAWVVDLKKDEHKLKTHLELSEADECMEGKQGVSLGLQIA